jgi:putative cardiolipin synthase
MNKWPIFISLIASIAFANAKVPDPFKSIKKSTHEITLLNNGLASFEVRMAMIERAQHTIDVEYFIYNLDKSGKSFTQALIKKAHDGVKVRLLLDYFMVKKTFSPFYAYEMEKAGIEVKYFNTSSSLIKGEYRNHRKVLLIDGAEVITGGRNIGDEYFDLNKDFNFLDRDLLIKGDIVDSIQDTFNIVWDSELSRVVAREKAPEKSDGKYLKDKGVDLVTYMQDLKKYNETLILAKEFVKLDEVDFLNAARSSGKAALQKEFSGNCENMTFLSEYPIIGKSDHSERIIKHDIADRFKNAKESVLFDSPYFIVDDEARDALETALSNNVEVTLLTNSLNSTDAVYVYAAFDTLINKWISKGLKTYLYKGTKPQNYDVINEEISNARFGIHAKSFVFDKKDVVIGTFNFDPRSANLNTEMTVACDNAPELAEKVTQDIQERIQNSFFLDSAKKVQEVQYYNVGFKKRIEYLMLKIPSNVLDFLL